MDSRDFDAWSGGWGLSWLIDPFQIWHSSQADAPKGSNRSHFRNKEADAIIEELRVTFDSKRRLELMHAFHRLLHHEQPYTFFYAPRYHSAWHKRVQNVQPNKIRPQFLPLTWWLE